MNTTEISKGRKIAGWIIAGLLTALYFYSATLKLIIHPEQMEQIKLADWRIIIAVGQITCALLFLFPRTNIYGTLLLSAYMGGAIIIHMISGISFAFPLAVLILVWLGGFIRNPELLKR